MFYHNFFFFFLFGGSRRKEDMGWGKKRSNLLVGIQSGVPWSPVTLTSV